VRPLQQQEHTTYGIRSISVLVLSWLAGFPIVPGSMFRALQMLAAPMQAWQAVVAANRGFAWGLFCVLLPFMILGISIENAGILKFGEKRGEFAKVAQISKQVVVKHAIVETVAGLLVALVAAKLIAHVGSGMNLYVGYGRIFAVVACAMMPFYLLKIPDGHPFFPTWVCFAVGAALCCAILYHGVGLGLQPEQTKGFGLFMLTLMIVVALAGVAHLLSVVTLDGKLLESWTVPGVD
jgi:hypothetical protein